MFNVSQEIYQLARH